MSPFLGWVHPFLFTSKVTICPPAKPPLSPPPDPFVFVFIHPSCSFRLHPSPSSIPSDFFRIIFFFSLDFPTFLRFSLSHPTSSMINKVAVNNPLISSIQSVQRALSTLPKSILRPTVASLFPSPKSEIPPIRRSRCSSLPPLPIILLDPFWSDRVLALPIIYPLPSPMGPPVLLPSSNNSSSI